MSHGCRLAGMRSGRNFKNCVCEGPQLARIIISFNFFGSIPNEWLPQLPLSTVVLEQATIASLSSRPPRYYFTWKRPSVFCYAPICIFVRRCMYSCIIISCSRCCNFTLFAFLFIGEKQKVYERSASYALRLSFGSCSQSCNFTLFVVLFIGKKQKVCECSAPNFYVIVSIFLVHIVFGTCHE